MVYPEKFQFTPVTGRLGMEELMPLPSPDYPPEGGGFQPEFFSMKERKTRVKTRRKPHHTLRAKNGRGDGGSDGIARKSNTPGKAGAYLTELPALRAARITVFCLSSSVLRTDNSTETAGSKPAG
jgi:hypothetical protein